MNNRKSTLVADYLHYPISISQIEKMVISTQIFNRLHNILQNSTAFFTYPSNRTSRFSHSLGCMHIAGLIFRYGFINAEEEQKAFFLQDVYNEINQIKSSPAFRNDINNLFPLHCSTNPHQIHEDIGAHLNEVFYKTILPGDIDETTDRYSFLISYQSVRIVALLHDIGHPPFSHVTENALNDLYVEFSTENTEDISEEKQKFLELISHYKQGEKGIHEVLGEKLVDFLFYNVFESLKNDDEWKLCYESVIIKYFVLRILQTDTRVDDRPDIFWSFHRIIDSNLDADRLDYVNRDLTMSGLSKDSYRYGRLISSFQMIYHTKDLLKPKGDEKGILEFLPSVRALSTIEEFYHKRFDLYKYVIYHHRVVKTDGLMASCIKELAKELLSKTVTDETTDRNSYLLPQNISGLWRVLDPSYKEECVNSYIQWDDAWLLSIFRKRYFELQNENEKSGNDRSVLEIQLEEILSNKKSYFSLYKRVDSFQIIDEATISSISENFDWAKLGILLSYTKNNIPVSTDSFNDVDKYYKDYSKIKIANNSLEGFTRLHESSGFFISVLYKAFHNAGMIGSFKSIVTQALERVRNESIIHDLKIVDAFVIFKQLSPGVTNALHLVMDDQVVRLGSVSRISDELQRTANLFPPFYIYFYSNPHSTNVLNSCIIELRKSFGTFFAQTFENWVLQSK